MAFKGNESSNNVWDNFVLAGSNFGNGSTSSAGDLTCHTEHTTMKRSRSGSISSLSTGSFVSSDARVGIRGTANAIWNAHTPKARPDTKKIRKGLFGHSGLRERLHEERGQSKLGRIDRSGHFVPAKIMR